jgi:hypothetical protein
MGTMEIAEIRREKILSVRPVGNVDLSIADLAAEILGYNVKEVKEEHEQVVVLPTLRAALAELEIEILNERDVARYKMEKRHASEKAKAGDFPQREVLLFWQDTPIDRYRKPIPEFVLNKAIQIKRAVPEVTISIEELDENPDPFLVVNIGYKEKYYIEVWEEPGFEGRAR